VKAKLDEPALPGSPASAGKTVTQFAQHGLRWPVTVSALLTAGKKGSER